MSRSNACYIPTNLHFVLCLFPFSSFSALKGEVLPYLVKKQFSKANIFKHNDNEEEEGLGAGSFLKKYTHLLLKGGAPSKINLVVTFWRSLPSMYYIQS